MPWLELEQRWLPYLTACWWSHCGDSISNPPALVLMVNLVQHLVSVTKIQTGNRKRTGARRLSQGKKDLNLQRKRISSHFSSTESKSFSDTQSKPQLLLSIHLVRPEECFSASSILQEQEAEQHHGRCHRISICMAHSNLQCKMNQVPHREWLLEMEGFLSFFFK